jgi:hypothetical protein
MERFNFISDILFQVNQPVPYDDSFFTAGLFTYFILMFASLLVIYLTFSFLAILLLFIFLAIATTGILSVSLIYGLYQKSLTKSFKMFFILMFGLIGSLSCSVVFPILNSFFHWSDAQTVIVIGVFIGLISGLLSGILLFRIFLYFLKKYQKTTI